MTQEAGSQATEVKLLPVSEMETMSHSQLLQARMKAKTPEEQKHIAPYEHRAFAREYVEENPVAGTIGMAVSIPGYQVAKGLGLHGSRTGVDTKQMVEGAKGVAEGLGNAIKAPWKRVWNKVEESLQPQQNKVPTKPWEKDWKGRPEGKEISKTPPSDQFESVFKALIHQESRGKHMDEKGNLTRSPVGALGITQVMPKTAADPGYGVTPIQDNTEKEYIRFGRDYLKAMLKEFDGDYEKALAAYNAGAPNVKKAIAKGGESWKQHLPKPSETLPYIQNIMGKANGEKGTVQEKR